MEEMRLIPYHVESTVEQTSEVPKGIELIQAPEIWDESKKGKGVVVAVIDTGVQTDHPDLADRIIGGYNFTSDYDNDPNNFYDNNGHGTHVSGTIAASENDQGVVGVAPEASILALKVLTSEGSGQYDWIIKGIQYATNWKGAGGERVGVISMSLGGPEDVPEMHQAIIEAVNSGIPVVVAAGNEGDNREDTFEYSYPGSYNEVIEVGAVDLDLKLASFSDTNTEVDVVAPGVQILSTYPQNKYAVLSGTSMATPHVSGAIALLKNLTSTYFDRELTEAELYAQLIRRTLPLGYRGSSEGNGIVSLDLLSQIQKVIKPATEQKS
ncbi:S8 family peptidase [Pullulanibacillus camelliae]